MVQYCGGRTAVECAADRGCLDPTDEHCQRKRPCGKCATCIPESADSTECDIDIGISDENQVESTIDYFKAMQFLIPYIQYLDR